MKALLRDANGAVYLCSGAAANGSATCPLATTPHITSEALVFNIPDSLPGSLTVSSDVTTKAADIYVTAQGLTTQSPDRPYLIALASDRDGKVLMTSVSATVATKVYMFVVGGDGQLTPWIPVANSSTSNYFYVIPVFLDATTAPAGAAPRSINANGTDAPFVAQCLNGSIKLDNDSAPVCLTMDSRGGGSR